MALQFRRMHHPGLVVRDLDRAVAWYRDTLGFEVEAMTSAPEFGLRFGYLRRGESRLELFQKDGSEGLREGEDDLMASFQYAGFRHFAFEVDDVDATWAEIQALGLDEACPPTRNADLGVYYCFIRDPDGNLLEFIRNE